MPNTTQARKNNARAIVAESGISYQDAIKILEHPEAARSDLLDAVINGGHKTHKSALEWLDALPAAERLLCVGCGWTNGMICPECSPGCGCSTGCSGWRHQGGFDGDDDGAYEDSGCPDCGAGGEYEAPCECEDPAEACSECGHSPADNGCIYHCDCSAC
ncbi:hypothetical protein [Streptomyces subrutilus]|uniref:Uncharacterized protein n=1 Tax=Streptomyces subrutilus TaxID=36818 RepID=A0A1E5NY53_9ACTN|nr:hypothetical protein [Streptomyces subrutilus]OEJ21067.1 hypothetical protein BGK67_34810 [Streptomyces subrutilus]